MLSIWPKPQTQTHKFLHSLISFVHFEAMISEEIIIDLEAVEEGEDRQGWEAEFSLRSFPLAVCRRRIILGISYILTCETHSAVHNTYIHNGHEVFQGVCLCRQSNAAEYIVRQCCICHD